MAEEPEEPKPLRILEIGGYEFFATAVPEQTTFYRAAPKPRRQAGRAFGPLRLVRALLDLRSGKYDLLVIHTSQYAIWHPRTVLTTLRDWNVLSPLGLFALVAWRLIAHFHRVPIAAVDLSDSFGVGRHNFFLLDRCAAFFKRELPSDAWQMFYKTGHRDFPGASWRRRPRGLGWLAKTHPISFGCAVEPPEDLVAEKTVDIFFSGALGHSTARTSGEAELRALAREGYRIDIMSERLPREVFWRRMAGAWLAWSPAGLGWDCERHYEAALVGATPLINYPTILRHAPLKDGEHCILYAPEPGGLAEAARAALADKPRLARIAQAASAHVRQHHSWRARAEYVAVTVLGRRLDGARAEPVRADGAAAPLPRRRATT